MTRVEKKVDKECEEHKDLRDKVSKVMVRQREAKDMPKEKMKLYNSIVGLGKV